MPKAWRFGDNVDTDVIIPARYLTTDDEDVLGSHVLEDLDPSFASRVEPGDVVVAGVNFGCGSSREHAPIALRASGVEAVVASSFARIFFRNAVNTGLPIVTCPEAAAAISDGDEVEVEPATGVVTVPAKGLVFTGEPLPAFVLEIAQAGGLVEWVRKKVS